MNTRSTRSSTSNLLSTTAPLTPSKETVSDANDGKSAGTTGRRCSSRLGKVSESESIPDETNDRIGSCAIKMINMVGSKENVTSSPALKGRSKSGQNSDTESIESSSSVSTRRHSTRAKKSDDTDDGSKNATSTGKRSSSRLSQASGMESTEDLTVAGKGSTYSTRRSRRLSETSTTGMGSTEDLSVGGKGSTVPVRRSTRRLSETSGMGSTEDLSVADKGPTAPVRRSTRRLSETSEDLTVADKGSSSTVRRSRRLSETSEDLTVADKGSTQTGRRSSSRLSQVSGAGSTEDLTVADKVSAYSGRKSSRRLNQAAGMGSTEDLTATDKLIGNRLPRIDECVNLEENNLDAETTESMADHASETVTSEKTSSVAADVSGIKSTPVGKRVSSRLSKDSVLEDTKKVLDEPKTPRRTSTRLRKESETMNSQELEGKGDNLEPIKEDASLSESPNAKENEKNPGNQLSAEIITTKPNQSPVGSANKSPRIANTPKRRSNSSPFNEIKEQERVVKRSLDSDSITSVAGKISADEEKSAMSDSQSPRLSRTSVKSNNSYHSDILTSLPVVKLVDCQKLNTSKDDSSSDIAVVTSDSQEVTSSEDPYSLCLLKPCSPGESCDGRTEDLPEDNLEEQPVIKPNEKASESNSTPDISFSKDRNSKNDLAASQKEITSSDVSCDFKILENFSQKSPKAKKAESKLQEKTGSPIGLRESPRKKSRGSSKFEVKENIADSSTEVQDLIPKKTLNDSVHSITKVSVVEIEELSVKPIEENETFSSEKSEKTKKRVSTEGVKKVSEIASSPTKQKVNEIMKEDVCELDSAVQEGKSAEVLCESEISLEDSDSNAPELVNLNYSDDDDSNDVAIVNDENADSESDSNDVPSDTIRRTDSTVKRLSKDNAVKNDVSIKKKSDGKSQSQELIGDENSTDMFVEEVIAENDSEKTKKDCGKTNESEDVVKDGRDDVNTESLDLVAESDDENDDGSDDVIAESDEENAESIDMVAGSDDENVENDAMTESDVNSDKVQEISAERKDKHVTFGGDFAKPIKKSPGRSVYAKLCNPEYVLKINSYITNVLDGRQQLKKISKFSDPKNHKKTTKKIENSALAKSKPNLEKIPDKSDGSKNKKQSTSANGSIKCEVDTSTLLKNKIKPANISDKPDKNKNQKEVPSSDGKLFETVSKKYEGGVSILPKSKPDLSNISDKSEKNKSKKKFTKTDGNFSESVSKKCEVDLKEKSKQDRKESSVVQSNQNSNHEPSTSNKQNFNALNGQNSAKEKLVEKNLVQPPKENLFTKRKYEEEKPSAEKSSKKSKKKKRHHLQEDQIQKTPFDKAAVKMGFNVSEKDTASTQNQNAQKVFDKNSKSSFSVKSNTAESKEIKTSWGKISIASNSKNSVRTHGNKTADPANKWNIKPASADTTEVKKPKFFKAPETFTVKPSVAKIMPLIDLTQNSIPKSSKTELKNPSANSKASQLPKESHQTQQNGTSVKSSTHNSKSESYPNVSSIKKKRKRNRKKNAQLSVQSVNSPLKVNTTSAKLMEDLVSRYLDKNKQSSALKKPFAKTTDSAVTSDPKTHKNRSPAVNVVEKQTNVLPVSNQVNDLKPGKMRKLGFQDVFCKKTSDHTSSARKDIIPILPLAVKNKFVDNNPNRKRNLPTELGGKITVPTKKPHLENTKQTEGANSESLSADKKVKPLSNDFLDSLTDQVQQNSLNQDIDGKKRKRNRNKKKKKGGSQFLDDGGKAKNPLQADFIPFSGHARFKVAVVDKPSDPNSSNNNFKNQHLQRKSLKREPVKDLLAYSKKQKLLTNSKWF